MKKMIAFFKLFVVFLLVLLFIIGFVLGIKGHEFDNKKVFSKFNDYEKVTIISKENFLGQMGIENGEFKYYTYSKFQESETISVLDKGKVEGIVFHFSQDKDFQYFQKAINFNLTSPEDISNIEVCYGYTSLFDRFILIKGKKANVQIAKNDCGWLVGLPMILTGF